MMQSAPLRQVNLRHQRTVSPIVAYVALVVCGGVLTLTGASRRLR